MQLSDELTSLAHSHFLKSVTGFERVNIDGLEGNDFAIFQDSPGSDTFIANSDKAILIGENEEFVRYSRGFEFVRLNGDNGGNNELRFDSDVQNEFLVFGDWVSSRVN